MRVQSLEPIGRGYEIILHHLTSLLGAGVKQIHIRACSRSVLSEPLLGLGLHIALVQGSPKMDTLHQICLPSATQRGKILWPAGNTPKAAQGATILHIARTHRWLTFYLLSTRPSSPFLSTQSVLVLNSSWGWSSSGAGLDISLHWISWDSCWSISLVFWGPFKWHHSPMVY